MKNRPKRSTLNNVSIIGAANKQVEFVIMELQQNLKEYERLVIKIYDKNEDPDKDEYLLSVLEDFVPILHSGPGSLKIVRSLSEVLKDCDLLVVIEDYSR